MAERVQGAYEQLIGRARQLGVLASCSALLGWDEQTYMPRGGSAHRGEQMARYAAFIMAAVSETIVREYFELHEFLVRQHRKHISPNRKPDEDDDIDFFVLNPKPRAGRGDLLLQRRRLHQLGLDVHDDPRQRQMHGQVRPGG